MSSSNTENYIGGWTKRRRFYHCGQHKNVTYDCEGNKQSIKQSYHKLVHRTDEFSVKPEKRIPKSIFLSFFLTLSSTWTRCITKPGWRKPKLIKQRIGIYFLYQYIKCFMSFYPLGSRWIQTQDKYQVTAGRIWLFRIIMCMLAGNKQGQPLQDLSFVTNSCKCSDPRSSAKSTNQSTNKLINKRLHLTSNLLTAKLLISPKKINL